MTTPNYVDTADATAYPQDIKNGETAYARGSKITGTQGYYVQGDTLYCPSDWQVETDAFGNVVLVVPDSWLNN